MLPYILQYSPIEAPPGFHNWVSEDPISPTARKKKLVWAKHVQSSKFCGNGGSNASWKIGHATSVTNFFSCKIQLLEAPLYLCLSTQWVYWRIYGILRVLYTSSERCIFCIPKCGGELSYRVLSSCLLGSLVGVLKKIMVIYTTMC